MATINKEGLAALLVFAQNSHFNLSGCDIGGLVSFQCAVVTGCVFQRRNMDASVGRRNIGSGEVGEGSWACFLVLS